MYNLKEINELRERLENLRKNINQAINILEKRIDEDIKKIEELKKIIEEAIELFKKLDTEIQSK